MLCWLECVVRCTYIPRYCCCETQVCRKYISFFIYTSVVSSLCAVVLSSTTPSLLLFVRLSSVPIILHAKRTEDRMQEGSYSALVEELKNVNDCHKK